VRKATPDKVLAGAPGIGRQGPQTSLSHDDEAKLQAALSAAKHDGLVKRDNEMKRSAEVGFPVNALLVIPWERLSSRDSPVAAEAAADSAKQL